MLLNRGSTVFACGYCHTVQMAKNMIDKAPAGPRSSDRFFNERRKQAFRAQPLFTLTQNMVVYWPVPFKAQRVGLSGKYTVRNDNRFGLTILWIILTVLHWDYVVLSNFQCFSDDNLLCFPNSYREFPA